MTEQDRINSILQNGGEHLKHFKRENITYNMCLVAVRNDGTALQYVPEEYRTKEIYEEACKRSGMALSLILPQDITTTLCEYAVESFGSALQYVPEEMKTTELCKKAAIVSEGSAYRFIPEKYITPEFVVDVAHQSNRESVRCLPKSFKKSSFIYDLLRQDPELIWYFPFSSLSAKAVKAAITGMGYASTADAVKALPELMSKLPYSLYDHDSCLCFVTSDFFRNSRWDFNSDEDREAGRIFREEKYNDTYSLHHMMQWPDVALHLISYRGYFIDYCQEDILSEEICKAAVNSDAYTLKSIPEKFLTRELCLAAFGKDPGTIQYIPAEYITETMALKAVCEYGGDLHHIPETLRTKQVCLAAVKTDGYADIEDVPLAVLDKEIILAYFPHLKFRFHELNKIPKSFWDYDVCLAAVKAGGDDLQYVPTELMDSAMCKAAVMQTPWAVKFVPETLFSEEIALAAVRKNRDCIQYIPKSALTADVCFQAIQSGRDTSSSVLKYVPPEILTQKMCDLAVEKTPHSIRDVPDKFITENLLLSVNLSLCGLSPLKFPKRLQTEEFIEKFTELHPWTRKFLPEKFAEEE